ncbi:hypothetical protein ACFS5J_04520 [Flavobacterium chuncheonense]|uniref:Uncharacterized protein n=1 Tax=Flavobacterium chuncheonense TaxID=2026653 RepID=A0ABW5YJT3_9FLAO
MKNSIYKHIGTFAPNDITALEDIITLSKQQNSLVKNNEFAYYLVCDEGNYAIKLTDLMKLQVFTLVYKTNIPYREKVNKFYLDNNMAHGKPKNEQNIGFLKFLKNFQLGIEYYEADENFENWKKLELNSSENDINKTPC